VIALDTNVLVRYLTWDDAEQAAQAQALIDGAVERAEQLFVGHVVICEVAWVLGRVYRLPKPDVVAALSGLLRAAQLVIEEADLANRALRRFKHGGADFADYLIAERAAAAGCEQLATFDGKLLEEEGFFRPSSAD